MSIWRTVETDKHETHRTNKDITRHTAAFSVSTEVVYVQRCLVVTWLVPGETAAVSAHILCTPYNHAPCHVTSCKATYIGCMRV